MNTENKEVILLILKTLIPSVYLSCLTNIADKHTRFKMQSLNSISLKQRWSHLFEQLKAYL